MEAQIGDIIFIGGKEFKLFTNPLEEYWTASGKKRLAFCSTISNRRGYVASWEIIGDKLFLTGINGFLKKSVMFFWSRQIRCSLKHLRIPIKHEAIRASWFSGKLRIPQGKMLHFATEGYNARYEKELIITLVKGSQVKSVLLDYDKSGLKATILSKESAFLEQL